MGSKDKEGLTWSELFAFFGITLPLYCILAPKWFRDDLIEYTGRFFIGFILTLLALSVLYFAYLLLLKDKIEEKRYKKAIEEEEERIRLARKMAERYE